MVQSKSELALATYFAGADVGLGDYTYNRKLEGDGYPYRLRPDFSWETDAGELVLWEHLGMLDREDYRRGWEKKHAWYLANGYKEDVNLFLQLPRGYRTTTDDLLALKIRSATTPDQPLIPLRELVKTETTPIEKSIYHKNLMPVTYVIGDVAGEVESPVAGPSRSGSRATAAARSVVRRLRVDPRGLGRGIPGDRRVC